MTVRGHRFVFAFLLTLISIPAFAQQDDRITKLEQRLDELLRQAESIRQELQQLKGGDTTTDLTQVEVTAEPAPSLADVTPIDNVPAPAASKALNPDISVIGNFIGHAGDQDPFDPRGPLDLDEVEVAFQAFIDPYAKGLFFIAVGPEGAEVEEGYAQFVTLPWGLTAKAGKIKATFGKANTWHTHQRPWIDQPLMVTRFFGDEGIADVGVSVSKSVGNPFGAFIEATGEVYSGSVEGAFQRQSDNDLLYNAHLKLFKDLSENSNVEVGTSWARGTAGGHGHNQLAGADLTYRWKPLQRSIDKSFIARFEGVANKRPGIDETLYGFYASADYQLARRWHAGVRFDSADRADFDLRQDRGVSATLSFWPSEFSQIRGQLRRTQYERGPAFNEVLLQLQFSIGAHGAHTF
jgi:hypothetical protein